MLALCESRCMRFSCAFFQVSAESEGLPLNVQVSTKPFDDETCLRIMADLEAELRGSASS